MSAPTEESYERAVENGFPMVRSRRTWGPLTIFGTSVSTAIATWCFIIGGFVSFYLPAGIGTIAIIAGSLIGILFIVLACLPMCNKYGIDSVISSRPQLGSRGSVLSIAMIYGSTLGWNVLLFILLGRAVSAMLGAFGVSTPSWVVNVAGIAGVLIVVLMLRGGPRAVKDFSRPIAIAVLVLGFVILGLLIKDVGLQNLLDAPATFPYDDAKINWASGIEVLIASNLSWWAYTGAMVRNTQSARKALWPVVIGLGLAVGVGSLTGLYAGLAIPDSAGDPTQFLIDLGGPTVGVIALSFIVVANIGTAIVGVYASVLALRQVPALSKSTWSVSVWIAVVPAFIIVGFFADQAFREFPTFLAFLGVFFGPICGIQIVDYFVLRKQKFSVAALYDHRAGSTYHYWGGINPVGFIAFAVGVGVYIYLLDPVTYESRAPFQYLTATIPTVILSGLVYWLGAKFILTPLGKGGYAKPALDASSSELRVK